jgi:hypothetical protein
VETRYSRASRRRGCLPCKADVKNAGDLKALAAILLRIAGSTHPGPKLLTDHPDTGDRVATIQAMASPGPRRALLTEPEWLALKYIFGSVAS